MADSISNGSENEVVADQFPAELPEAKAPPHTPSRRLEALVGEHAPRKTQLTPESHHHINTNYASIDKALSELELRFNVNDQEILCALRNICHSETPDKRKAVSCVAKFSQNRPQDSGSRVRGLGYMTRKIYLICCQSFLM